MVPDARNKPVKVILLLKRKPGVTPEEFRRVYETGHSRLGMEKVGHLLLDYRRDYLGDGSNFAAAAPVSKDGAAQVEVPYDAVTEIVFRDMAALEQCNRIIGDPETRKFFSEDEATLFDRPNCWTIISDTVVEDLAPYARPTGPENESDQTGTLSPIVRH